MSAESCCLGRAAGFAHSDDCQRDAHLFRYGLDEVIRTAEGVAWKAERARNLREQRRYEIASAVYANRISAAGMNGEQAAIYARDTLYYADIFLDEMAKENP